MNVTLDLERITDELIAERRWRYEGDRPIPFRYRWLDPQALLTLPAGLVFSDVYRSPLGSLTAIESRRGSLPPGNSNHNFGRAVDLDIDASMRALGLTSKKQLDDCMAAHSWHCHRSDHLMEHEAWHYNYLEAAPAGRVSSDEAEAALVSLYGSTWATLANVAVEQFALKAVGLYEGVVDGDVGPLTRTARAVFKRKWLVDPRQEYHRVLWLVAESGRYT